MMKLSSPVLWLRRIVLTLLFVVVALIGFVVFRPPPQDLPWTPLRLDQPVGLFTGPKIALLGRDRAVCLAMMEKAGLRFDTLPPRGEGQCAVDDAVRIAPHQPMLSLRPDNVAPSCPIAIGLLIWQTQVVQPAALKLLGSPIARIEHLGSFSCRRLYGRSSGGWSEHASANAIDIAGFVLVDGRRVSVLENWADGTPKGVFLHAVRDGGCRVFATTLSPDYNAAHADHLHLDQADRGRLGWRACH